MLTKSLDQVQVAAGQRSVGHAEGIRRARRERHAEPIGIGRLVDDATVTGYEPLIATLTFPAPTRLR